MQRVNVHLVLLYHRCVIDNGLLVPAKLGEAVGAIVERLDVIRPALSVEDAVFDLVRIVLNR